MRPAAAFVGVLLATHALAGTNRTDTAVAVLPDIVVLASRVADSVRTLPASVQVFDAAALARSAAQDLPEFLSKKANVTVRTLNANPLQAEVSMRGFGEYSHGRVRVLMDGEDIAGADMEAPNLTRLPLGAIARVEVIPGPSPVLYGDGAVAGVVSVTTDTHDYARRTRLAVTGGAYGKFGASVETRGGEAAEGLLYSAAYGYRRADGYRDRSAYDLHALAAGLRRNFANGSTVGLKTHYYNARYAMPGALDASAWRRDSRQAAYFHDDCRTWSYGFALDSKMRLAEDQWLYVDGAFAQKHRRSRWGDCAAVDDYDAYVGQLLPRYVNEKDVLDHGSKMVLGLDFRYDAYGVASRSPGFDEREDFGRFRAALFGREEFFLTEALSVAAGVRGELIDNRWRTYRTLADAHTRDGACDGEVAVVYRPVSGLKTYAKATRFHRSAFCDELNYTADGTFLRPETGLSLDAGVDWDFAEGWRMQWNGYWMRMADEIFFEPAWRRVGCNCNSPDDTERLGFDAALAWSREKTAEASLRYGFVEARFRDGAYDGCVIPLVPQSRGRAEAGVWLGADVEVLAGWRFVSTQVLAGDFANAHGRLDAYGLFDVMLAYEPCWAPGWRVTAVVDNLLDVDYCDFARWSDSSGASYYPACGRSFSVTVSYAF